MRRRFLSNILKKWHALTNISFIVMPLLICWSSILRRSTLWHAARICSSYYGACRGIPSRVRGSIICRSAKLSSLFEKKTKPICSIASSAVAKPGHGMPCPYKRLSALIRGNGDRLGRSWMRQFQDGVALRVNKERDEDPLGDECGAPNRRAESPRRVIEIVDRRR